MINTFKMMALALIAILAFSCSKDDNPKIGVPTLEYSASINATFFTAGSYEAPSINWNGEQGSFSLTGSPVEGLNIDKNSGVLSWDKTLSPGKHHIEVTATNSAGSSVSTVELNNPLQGTFSGRYDFSSDKMIGTPSYPIEMEFHTDGSITGSGGNAGFELTGNWEITEDGVYVEYLLAPEDFAEEFSLLGEMIISGSSAYFGISSRRTIQLYTGYNREPGNVAGDIALCRGECIF